MNPTGPVKLSFRPNFQRQEPAPVQKQAKMPVQGDGDLDSAGPAIPTREPSTEEQGTVRRSTRRAAPRTKPSGLVPMHGLSDDFELLDDAAESNNASLPSEGNRRGPGTMPPPRRRDESRQQELAADPDPYTSGPSRYAPRTLPRYELPNEEPQDPGRLWICEFSRCGFREYAADTAEGLERVNEHLRETHDVVEEVVRDPRGSQQRSGFGYGSQQPSGFRSTTTTSGRRSPHGLGGNATQSSSSSLLPPSSNTRNFGTSEADPSEDGSRTVPEPTPRPRRMYRY